MVLEALELPPSIICDNGTNVTTEHALFCRYTKLAFPNRLGDPMELLGRDRSQLSRVFNKTTNLIYEKKPST